MDPSLVTALSTPSCKSCVGIAGEVQELKSKGQRLSSAPLAPVSHLAIASGATEGQRRVQFTLTQLAANVVDASGAVVDSQEAGTVHRLALVSWKGDRWVMEGLAEAS
jgi:hypothetical protein